MFATRKTERSFLILSRGRIEKRKWGRGQKETKMEKKSEKKAKEATPQKKPEPKTNHKRERERKNVMVLEESNPTLCTWGRRSNTGARSSCQDGLCQPCSPGYAK